MAYGMSKQQGRRQRQLGGWKLVSAGGLGLLCLAVGGVQGADAVPPAPAPAVPALVPAPVVGAEAPVEAPALLMLTAESLQATAEVWVPEQLKALGRKDGDPSVLIELKAPEGNDLAKVDVSGITAKLGEALNGAAGKAAYFRFRAPRPKTERPVMEKPMQEPDFVLTLTLGKAAQAQPEGEVTMPLAGVLTAFKKEAVLWQGSHGCAAIFGGIPLVGVKAVAIADAPEAEPIAAGPFELAKFVTQKNAEGFLQVTFVMANSTAKAEACEITITFLNKDRQLVADNVLTRHVEFDPHDTQKLAFTALSKAAEHYLIAVGRPEGDAPAPAVKEPKDERVTTLQSVDPDYDPDEPGTPVRRTDFKRFAEKITVDLLKAAYQEKRETAPRVAVLPFANGTTKQLDDQALADGLLAELIAPCEGKLKYLPVGSLVGAQKLAAEKGCEYILSCKILPIQVGQGIYEHTGTQVTAQVSEAVGGAVVASVQYTLSSVGLDGARVAPQKPLTRNIREDAVADEVVKGTGIRSADLNGFADKIVAAVTKAEGLRKGDARTPLVVVFPPQNRTAQQIDSAEFVAALEKRMNATGKDKMTVVVKDDGVNAMVGPKAKGYSYSVNCKVTASTARRGAEETTYMLATAQVVDAESTEVIATVEWEMRKAAKAADGDR